MADANIPSKVDTSRLGINIVLTPKKSITHENCKELEDLFDEAINKNRTRIVLDCKSVTFIDSKALELLIKVHDKMKSRGGILKVISLNPVCRDILLVTRLINTFNVYEDIHEAMRD